MLRSATRAFGPFLTTTTRSLTTTRICCSSKWGTASSSGPKKQASSADSKKKSNVNPQVPTILLENRCAFVRTWDFLRNPAEALALVRAVEQKYGPVENFSFQKDFDSPSAYQAQVKITFKDVDSFRRLPEDFETLHIRAPKVQPKRPGGIGLDEIQHVIFGDVEFLTADQVSEIASEERTIDFRIERAKRPYFEESPYRFTGLNYKYRREIGTKMLEWGGFHKMKPIESTRPITNEDLTNESLDHVYMRRTLREWAEFLGVRNPYEVYPEERKQLSVESIGTKTEEVREPLSTATVEQSSGTSRPKSSSPQDEWAILNASPQTRTIREPIEQLLEMEDIKGTAKVPVAPEEEAQPWDILTEEPPPGFEASSEEPITPTPLSQPKQTGTCATPETQFAVSATDSVPTSMGTSQPIQQSIASGSQGSETMEAESPSQPPAPPLQPLFHSKTPVKQEELDVQLEEAKQLEDSVRSSKGDKNSISDMKRKERALGAEQREPVKDHAREVPKDKPGNNDLEHNPRFENFFNRLQDLLKKS